MVGLVYKIDAVLITAYVQSLYKVLFETRPSLASLQICALRAHFLSLVCSYQKSLSQRRMFTFVYNIITTLMLS